MYSFGIVIAELLLEEEPYKQDIAKAGRRRGGDERQRRQGVR